MRPIATWKGQTSNPTEMKRLGIWLGRSTQRGNFLACCGPLGAGKTTLIQGIAQGLKVESDEYVRSPTFALVHEYRGKYPLYHFDFFRLSHWAEAYDVGFVDYLDGRGVVVVEWADRFPQLLPADRLDIYIQVLPSGDRAIQLVAYDSAYVRFLQPVLDEVHATE